MEDIMTKKLTLSLDSSIVEFAHDFSQKYDKPISRIIEDYFIALREQNTAELPKNLKDIYGIFEGLDSPDKNELRRTFHEKNCN